MTGQEVIDWALREVKRDNRLPYDSALINKIRECHNLEQAVLAPLAKAEEEGR